MKIMNKVLFYIFIIFAFLSLILNILRIFFNIDIFRNTPHLAKYVYILQDMPIALKLILIVVYFVIIVFLYKKFSSYIDIINKSSN